MSRAEARRLLFDLRRTLTQREIATGLGVSARTIARWEMGQTKCPSYLSDALSSLLEEREGVGEFTFVDLFAGIGGIRLAFERAGGACVLTSECDRFARQTYIANFGAGLRHQMTGNIIELKSEQVPDHDVLLAGFPCQPFSIAGVSKKNSLGRPHGFEDAEYGHLFFEVTRIIKHKRPRAFLLENVKNLMTHNGGKTFDFIRFTLEEELGYHVFAQVLDGSAYVPQRRRRLIIVGFNRSVFASAPNFDFGSMKRPNTLSTLSSILHPEDGSEPVESPYTGGPQATVSDKYTISRDLWRYLKWYSAKHRQAGNGFGFGLFGPDDVARTLSARYYKDGSEILISRGPRRNPRRLTPRECARLMGFTDDFAIPVSDTQAYKQFGNSVVVPLIEAVAKLMLPYIVVNKTRSVNARHSDLTTRTNLVA